MGDSGERDASLHGMTSRYREEDTEAQIGKKLCHTLDKRAGRIEWTETVRDDTPGRFACGLLIDSIGNKRNECNRKGLSDLCVQYFRCNFSPFAQAGCDVIQASLHDALHERNN